MNLQPQRVPLGSFKTPQGQEVQVYISQPWFRSLVALANAPASTTPVTPTDGAPANGPYVTAGSSPGTPDSRSLNVDTSLQMVDDGPGADVALGLAVIPSLAVLANPTAGVSQPMPTSVTTLFDAIFGSVQGNILYRGAASWLSLAPGVAGQSLKTGGPAANPSWGTNVSLSTILYDDTGRILSDQFGLMLTDA